MNSKEHYDKRFKRNDLYSQPLIADSNAIPYNRCLSFFGNLNGKRVLDIGVGSGKSSLLFGSLGAIVTAVDISDTAINNLNDYISDNNIANINAFTFDGINIDELGQFDYIYGSMILHHIEPFDEFVDSLYNALGKNGKAFFHENSSRSKLLMAVRKLLVGKLCIPKHSDDTEYPLEPKEVELLKNHFEATVEYPYLHYFRMMTSHLLVNKIPSIGRVFGRLDDLLYSLLPFIRKYSYHQYILLKHK